VVIKHPYGHCANFNKSRKTEIHLSLIDEKIAITITTMSSSHHVSSAPAAMTTAAPQMAIAHPPPHLTAKVQQAQSRAVAKKLPSQETCKSRR
jgi:hypothetical protein